VSKANNILPFIILFPLRLQEKMFPRLSLSAVREEMFPLLSSLPPAGEG